MKNEQNSVHSVANRNGLKRLFTPMKMTTMACGILFVNMLMTTGCTKEQLHPNANVSNEVLDADGDAKAYGQVFWPTSGNNCNTNSPALPPSQVGWSAKKNWHIKVNNQAQFINAINQVNSNGGVIYINSSLTLNTTLPTITRSNVTILSNKNVIINDNVVGNSRATAMLNVTGSNFTMKNVTIKGAGRTNPNSFSWPGKRSAVSVSGNNATFFRVKVQYFSHAGIRLENGSGHTVDKCILTDQKLSTLGYGVLLRNDARNVTIKNSRFARCSHSVATTGGKRQSFKAIRNLTQQAYKWHFDAHMGSDGWAGDKVEIINNISTGTAALVVVRGPFDRGIFIKNNLFNRGAGDLAKLKPDATFTKHGHTYTGGFFYMPFAGSSSDRTKARAYFGHGEITGNCIWQ